MIALQPFENILPGTWKLSFVDQENDITGAGTYDFKLAGVFNAEVRDAYSGNAKWHGYWHVAEAGLFLDAQEMTSWCSSCLGTTMGHHWSIELERVGDAAFSGIARTGQGQVRQVLFERMHA